MLHLRGYNITTQVLKDKRKLPTDRIQIVHDSFKGLKKKTMALRRKIKDVSVLNSENSIFKKLICIVINIVLNK